MRSQQEIRSELHKTGTPHLRRIRVTGEGAGKAPEDTEDYGLTLKELALIAKSSKHENAKQPHWAQARSSCWGTRSPPL